jgi:hypothetical protein
MSDRLKLSTREIIAEMERLNRVVTERNRALVQELPDVARGGGCYAASMATKRKLSPAFKKNAALVKAGRPPLKKASKKK